MATKGKKVATGDVTMMMKRLKIFEFCHVLTGPRREIKPCAHCWATLLLGRQTAQDGDGKGAAQARAQSAPTKRERQGPTGDTPGPKRSAGWSVEDVVGFLGGLDLGHVAPAFRMNAIDGLMLADLSEKDMVEELGLTPLQARKVRARVVP